MTKLEVVQRALEFLEATPITGADAEAMVACKQWLRNLETAAKLLAVPPSPVAAPQSVEPT